MKAHLPLPLLRMLLTCMAGISTMQTVCAAVSSRQVSYKDTTYSGDDIDIRNGYHNGNGAAVYVSASLTFTNINNISFVGNTTYSSDSAKNALGGAIYASGNIVFRGVKKGITFKNNTAIENNAPYYGRGGAIFSFEGVAFQNNAADILFDSNTVKGKILCSRGGAINANGGLVSFTGNTGDIVFRGNKAFSYGGAIMAWEGLEISKNSGAIVFDGNISERFGGSALCAEKNLYIKGNTNTITFSNNVCEDSGGAIEILPYNDGVLEISGNTGDINFTANRSNSGAAAINARSSSSYAPVVVSISGNRGDITFADNVSAYSSYAYGALGGYRAEITIADNAGRLVFNNNQLTQNWALSYYRAVDKAGGICVLGGSSLAIKDNKYVEFRGNCVSHDASGVLDYCALSALYSTSDISLSAPKDGEIRFYDPMTVVGGVTFNAATKGVSGSGTGQIVFSSAYAKEDLTSWLGSEPSYQCLALSCTTVISGSCVLKGGSLHVQENAIFSSESLQLEDNAKSSLHLENGSLKVGGKLVIGKSDALYIAGSNDITAGSLSFSDSSVLNVAVTEENKTSAPLMLTGDLVQSGTLTVCIDADASLPAAKYKILTIDKTKTATWNAARVEFENPLSNPARLLWSGTTLYLYVRDGSIPLKLTWMNDSGSNIWNANDVNWRDEEGKTRFEDRAQVCFTNNGVGKVVLQGVLSPEEVTVSNSTGAYVFSGTGSMGGDMKLTKTQSGSLTLNASNTYTGGTVISGGKLIVSGASSLGTGAVELQNGTLDLGGYAVKNEILVSGGLIKGAQAYAGEMRISSVLSVDGTLSAKVLEISGGTLGGGEVRGSCLKVQDGVVSSVIAGTGNVLSSGQVSLQAANTYTGGTVVEDGCLSIGHAQSLGRGMILLQGGALNMEGKAVLNGLTACGGRISGASAYAGELTIQGAVRLDGNTMASKLMITSGSLTGGSIVDTPIEARAGVISSVISGNSSLISAGNVTLNGSMAYSGETHVSEGTLTVNGSLAGSAITVAASGRLCVTGDVAGDITLDGGVFQAPSLSLASGRHMDISGGRVQGTLSLGTGAVLSTSGNATVQGDFVLAGGLWSIQPDSKLTVSGKLVLDKESQVEVGGFSPSSTPYTIATYQAMEGSVDALRFNQDSSSSRLVCSLADAGSALLLYVSGGAATISWNGGDGVWQIKERGKWLVPAEAAGPSAFLNGDAVEFAKSGTVSLVGELLPSSVKVQGDASVVFTGGGSVSGSTQIVMESSGTLTLNDSNSFTGGISLQKGKIVATGANSLGRGRVTVQGGTLDLGGLDVVNALSMNGGTLTGASSYGGALTVNGEVALRGLVSAQTVTMNGGTLSGGSIKDATITAKKGEVSSVLTGASSLTVKGNVTLSGNHDYTGDTQVASGTLTVSGSLSRSGIIVAKGATLVVNGSVGGNVTLNGGSVSGNLVSTAAFETFGSASVSGDLSLAGTWICAKGASLNVGGTLDIGKSTVLDFSAFDIADTPYTVANVGLFSGDTESFKFTRGSGKSYNLALVGTELQLTVSECNTLLGWQGAKGEWRNGGSGPWALLEGAADGALFYDGFDVLFDSKATATIIGDVAPATVTVQVQGKDTLTLSGKGAITGAAPLFMEGTGTLKMNATNAYTGGTVISSGTVTATGDRSFGTGSISLNGGTLNLGGKVVANAIHTSGGLLTGAAKYAGELTVADTLELKGNLLAKSVTVDGTLKAGTIKDTAITLNDGGITSAISGKSSVLVTGEASLTGKLSHTGGTTLAGGSIASNFTVAAKQTLAASTGSIGGDLTLGGGSILLADGMKLDVSGAMKLTKASTLDVSSLGGSATIAFDSLTGDTAKFLKLSAPTEGRKSYAMEIGEKVITVTASGDNTDLTWQGAKGKWEVVGAQQWAGTSSDNRFYHGDNDLGSAATVTLATKLAPGNVTVTGNGAVTFSGSGSIAGAAALTMSGSNTLKMNATNTYTGGTTITNGTVLATGVDSFGKGDITLSGGTLNLGKKAIKNSILVDGTATILNGKGFAGVITVEGGTLSLTDSLTGTLVLNGGTLNLSGVKNIAKLTFGNVICEAETDIVDAKGQRYAFVGNKLVQVDRTVAATPVPQHAELPGAGLYTTMMRAQLDGNRAAFDSIRQLMGSGETSSADGRYRFAAQATSASTDMKDYRRQGFGGLVMVEEVFSSKAVGGLSLNYEHADINPDGAGKFESDDTRVNAHLLVSSKNWQSRSIAGIGIHDYDVNHASATGHSFNLMEEISRTIAVDDKSVIAPFVRVETGYNVIGSINDGVLSIDKQTAWSTDMTLGARFVKTCDFGTVMLEAGVTKAIGDQGGAIGASLVDAPATRAALSPSSRNRWSATLGGSVQVPVGERSAIQAGATLRLHGGTTEVNANVGYSIKF